MHGYPFRLVLALFFALPFVSAAEGQDFRVEADVFLDEKDESILETLTLFKGDFVYDFFLKGPEEVTIYDAKRSRIVLLDNAHRVQTTLTTEQLLQLSQAMQTVGQEKGNKPLFEPQFTTDYDDTQRVLKLTSEWLTYQAKCAQPKVPNAAERFRQFADWYARLNAVRPGNLPPFGRLELNSALAQRGLIPAEIERTVVLDRPITNKTLHARSQHLFVWTLSGTDQKRIEKAGQDLASFESVSLSQYWQAGSVASRQR